MRTTLVIIMLIALTACGQKGPLYLPTEEAPADPAGQASENSYK